MKYLIVSFLALTVACTASLEKYSLVEGLKDPMEVAIARDGQLYVVEREGRVLRINPQTGGIFELGNLHVQCVNASDPKSKYGREDGLLGIALDPNFSHNQRIFLYYSTRESSANRLSRFTLKAGRIDFSSEVKLLEIPTERENFASHQAGSVEFGPTSCSIYRRVITQTPSLQTAMHPSTIEMTERTGMPREAQEIQMTSGEKFFGYAQRNPAMKSRQETSSNPAQPKPDQRFLSWAAVILSASRSTRAQALSIGVKSGQMRGRTQPKDRWVTTK